MHLNYTWIFLQDLSEIEAYIALDNPRKALEVSQEIRAYCKNNLIKVPRRGIIIKENPETREVAGPYNYTIRFSITEETINLLMVYKWQNR